MILNSSSFRCITTLYTTTYYSIFVMFTLQVLRFAMCNSFFHLPLSSSRHHIERNTISSNCKNTSFFMKVKILDDIASPFLPLSHEIKMIIYQKIEIFNNVYFNKEPWAFICCTQSVWVINISGNCVITRQ